MTSAVPASHGSRRALLALALLLAASIGSASAQSPVPAAPPAATQRPPVSVGGWRYIEGPNELHVYVCDRLDCLLGSRIFYHLNPPNGVLPPGILRKQEAAVSEMLSEPSREFPRLEVEMASMRMHGVAMAPDGLRVYYAFAAVHGSKWDAWLSSASLDPKVSQANLEQFEAALQPIRND